MNARILLVTLLVGCRGEAHDAVPTAKVDAVAASVEAAHVRMHARFAAARRMEYAIAKSDLSNARLDAHLLAELDEPDALPSWRPYIGGIRDAAHQVEIAGDVVAAAQQTGTLGMRCAQCHEAINARVKFSAEVRPSADPKLAPAMLGHQWATMQMWEGLIGPSDERWTAGAQALTTVPLNVIAQVTTVGFDGDIDDVARVRLFARRALTMTSGTDRAELFGKMLGTCAHCHATLRDR